MLAINHQTNSGSITTYKYDTIGGVDINMYMCTMQKQYRRNKRISEGKSPYVHANEVPQSTGKELVEMCNSGKSWGHIGRQFNITDYIAKRVYQLYEK